MLEAQSFDMLFDSMEKVNIKKYNFLFFTFCFYQCSFCFDILQFMFFFNCKANPRVQMKILTYNTSLMSKDYEGLANFKHIVHEILINRPFHLFLTLFEVYYTQFGVFFNETMKGPTCKKYTTLSRNMKSILNIDKGRTLYVLYARK